MRKTVIINDDLKDLYNSFAIYLISIIQNNKDSQYVNIAISGGATPIGLFKYLSLNYKDKINWSKIRIFWVDERCVPQDNDESNYYNALKYLIIPLSLNPDNVFRIMGEDDPTLEAVRYSKLVEELVNVDNGYPEFNLVLLGIGNDGHTASIFPGCSDGDNNIYFATINPYNNQPRISMSMNVINNAKHVAFMMSGKEKREIFTSIYSSQSNEKIFPAQFVSPEKGGLIYFIDKSVTIYD